MVSQVILGLMTVGLLLSKYIMLSGRAFRPAISGRVSQMVILDVGRGVMSCTRQTPYFSLVKSSCVNMSIQAKKNLPLHLHLFSFVTFGTIFAVICFNCFCVFSGEIGNPPSDIQINTTWFRHHRTGRQNVDLEMNLKAFHPQLIYGSLF